MYRTIRALLEKSDCPFTPSGPTVGEIEALAAGIRDRLLELGAPADEPVCLCVAERSHLLAALLASMAGAPPFILPHAFQSQVLREVQVARPFRLILADTAVEPPEGAAVIGVAECRPSHHPLRLVRPPDGTFLSLFTGGSTGKPRIWSKTPANLFGEALHLATTFGIGAGDLILPTVPPQHIYGLLFYGPPPLRRLVPGAGPHLHLSAGDPERPAKRRGHRPGQRADSLPGPAGRRDPTVFAPAGPLLGSPP